MFCTNCGKEIQPNQAFCSNCGNAINNTAQQPQATINQQSYSAPNPQYTQPVNNQYNPQYNAPYAPQPNFQNNNLQLIQYADKAKNIKTLGIVATVLMFGIGFILSVVIWIMSSGLNEPFVNPENPADMEVLRKAKKDLSLGKKLSFAPIIALAFCFLFGVFLGMAGLA